MTNLIRDLRYAFRSLLKTPQFTLIAVLTLGLGVGANTAIFSLLDHLQFRNIAVREPHRLVRIPWRFFPTVTGSGALVATPKWLAKRSSSTTSRSPLWVWRQRGSVERTSRPPPMSFVPIRLKAWVTPTWDALEDPGFRWLQIFARLANSISREEAGAKIQVMTPPMFERYLNASKLEDARLRDRMMKRRLLLQPAGNGFSPAQQQTQKPLYILMALVACVLLITCANFSGLLVARFLRRERELAIRLFGVRPWDPGSIAFAAFVLLGAAPVNFGSRRRVFSAIIAE